MHWLHILTGFQLFIVWSVLEIAGWQADERWKREKRRASLHTSIINLVVAAAFETYWLVVAVWPVIAK